MTQNFIAIVIVFLAIGYTLFSIIKNLSTKQATQCSACSGCGFKKLPMAKRDCDKILP